MPLYDYLCLDCGKVTETLMTGSNQLASCTACGGTNVKRLLSAPSSLTGSSRQGMPGPGDTACCGSAPGMATGCAGPGSCCGH
ncbi:MAG: zinc ribbon domain-containing protein, partial [Thermodesulfobacteriota bacterium]